MSKGTRIVLALLAASLPSVVLAQSDSITYAFDHRGEDNLFRFSVDDPTTITQIGPVGNLDYSPFAMDFNTAGDTLYVVDGTTLGTVDTATGVFTAGPTITGAFGGTTETGLSVNAVDETYFLSDATSLYTLNPVTGVSTLVGNFSGMDPSGAPVGIVIDIAVDTLGNMFAHDVTTDSLWSINTATAAATHVGFSGLAANFAQGMDFDPATNLLYAAIYTGGGTGSYGTWDTTTGTFVEIMDLPSFMDPTADGRELEIAITTIPAPGVLALFGAAGLASGRRRRG